MNAATHLQRQLDAAQSLVTAQEQTIHSLRLHLLELQSEVKAWRAHAKAYNEWFTTVPRVGIPQLKDRHKRYMVAVEAREPYYQAALHSDQKQDRESNTGDINEFIKEDLSEVRGGS